MPVKVKDVNNIPKLKKKFKELRKRKVRAGILGDAKLALIGASNEFGAKIPISDVMRRLFAAKGFPIKKDTTFFIIPERSWLRSAFDDKKTMKEIQKMAFGVYSVDVSLNKTLNAIGLFLVSALQKKIKSNIQPGNHPFTTREKRGKNKTLVNTGRLGQGITHKIV